MARKLLLINELRRVYLSVNNPDKEAIVKDCIDKLSMLPIRDNLLSGV